MFGKAMGMSPVQRYLEQLHADLLEIGGGEVASYIPELTKADPAWLGIALVTVDGHVYQVGDTRQPFTIQSISKVFTMAKVIEKIGGGVVVPAGDPEAIAAAVIELLSDGGRRENASEAARASISITPIVIGKDSDPVYGLLAERTGGHLDPGRCDRYRIAGHQN